MQTIKPKFETRQFDIVWNLEFGVWRFALATNQADSRLKQREAGACLQ
ncbi:MAG TPA: hypothetical protein VIM71_10075 [Lacunisphaera sp.]